MKSTTRPLFAALAEAVRLLSDERDEVDRDAVSTNSRIREVLAGCLQGMDSDFRLKLRVAPVRQGPGGVLAYLLHEADRLSQLVKALPHTHEVDPHEEAARVSLTFLLHACNELSRVARRRTVEPHEGGRRTMFDELPFHSLRGLVPIALSMERVKTLKARVTRLEKAASSGLLTIAEEETTQAAGGEELGFFIDRTRKRQKWAMPLWVAPTHVAAAKSEPTPPSLSEEQVLLDQLEAEAAHSVGLDAEALSRLRTKFRVNTNELAREEQRILR